MSMVRSVFFLHGGLLLGSCFSLSVLGLTLLIPESLETHLNQLSSVLLGLVTARLVGLSLSFGQDLIGLVRLLLDLVRKVAGELLRAFRPVLDRLGS